MGTGKQFGESAGWGRAQGAYGAFDALTAIDSCAFGWVAETATRQGLQTISIGYGGFLLSRS